MKLSPSDREYFRLVSRAVFINPFSDERAELDREMAGGATDAPREALTRKTVEGVSQRLRRLAETRGDDLRPYSSEDRELLKNTLLFHLFHKFADRFDALIDEQMGAEETSPPVPFAGDLLSEFTRRGFSPTAACGYVAMFYQLRRAYYFIDQTLIGRSPAMKAFRLNLWNNVFTHDIRWYERYLWNRMEDFSTLILGETGTGKGAAAAAIGRSGFIPFDENKERFARSFMRTFISINLSQFPESLIESELFGHRKGAFTGAVDAYEGILGRCSPHGSIFLDEIGEVSIPIQIKLLQVLQERTYRPVGSHEKRRFQGRVIAATNLSLEDLRREGRIRDDFFYRLSSDIITAPTLRERIRERPEELDESIDHVIQRLVGRPSEDLSAMVREAMARDLSPDYAWPGNVRELEQAVRRILVTRTYAGDQAPVPVDLESRITADLRHGRVNAQELLAGYCALLHKRLGTYGEVARRVGLDWRTVKKYVDRHSA